MIKSKEKDWKFKWELKKSFVYLSPTSHRQINRVESCCKHLDNHLVGVSDGGETDVSAEPEDVIAAIVINHPGRHSAAANSGNTQQSSLAALQRHFNVCILSFTEPQKQLTLRKMFPDTRRHCSEMNKLDWRWRFYIQSADGQCIKLSRSRFKTPTVSFLITRKRKTIPTIQKESNKLRDFSHISPTSFAVMRSVLFLSRSQSLHQSWDSLLNSCPITEADGTRRW